MWGWLPHAPRGLFRICPTAFLIEAHSARSAAPHSWGWLPHVPRGLFRKGYMDKMEGVYYPFWVTDADTDCHLEAEATDVRLYTRGNTEVTETQS